MKPHPEREDVVLCADLIAPEGYGEIIGGSEREVDFDVEVGEVVTIVEGAFSGLTGEITEVDNEKQKLKVNIDMFGRETSTELDFNQIDKLS